MLSVVTLAACIKAPTVVIVDRKTALEEQAAGRYRPLEEDLGRALSEPRAVPLTGGEIVGAGEKSEVLSTVGGATMTEEAARSERVRIDGWLSNHCLGEAKDGTIVETPRQCAGDADSAQLARAVERANRNRVQVWQFLQQKNPSRTLDEIRATWRRTHLESVVCGAPVERADGVWENKKC